VTNFVIWKHISATWLEFVVDAHNVRLGLALDGVNPFEDFSTCHFTWLAVLLNYNLPPWLVTMRYFFMLSLNIHGKESCTSNNLDVVLQPLIYELQILCMGIHVHKIKSHGASLVRTLVITYFEKLLIYIRNIPFVSCKKS